MDVEKRKRDASEQQIQQHLQVSTLGQVLLVYMTGGGGQRSFILPTPPPKKKNEPEILHLKNYLESKFSTRKKYKTLYLNTDLFNQADLET